MKSKLSLAFLSAVFLAACGDTENVTEINQMGMDVVTKVGDLPKCTKDNEGELAFVKGESSTRICVEGEWFVTASGDGGSADFSCKTEELEDKSGLKIICNGDSIGVVLNGSDGKDGKQGKDGKDGKDGEDGKDGTADTTMADPEREAVSLDSLAGYTQKGPFLKGATVYLYELSDGRTLKQTNGNFTSKITRDDGHYKFSARDLVSQYAMLVVDGYYRNEVTGDKSDSPIRLTALTDMRKRSSVNVNLLTHMELDRVYNLVTRSDSTGKKLTVKQAKRQAQKEILKQFHIVLDDSTDAESMDVFGSSDADAALLAVSVLLQGDSSTTDLSVLLTEISNDIAEYGEWKNDSAKVAIADWALNAEGRGVFEKIRNNVMNWGLSENVPEFEKYLRSYYEEVLGLGKCGGDGNSVNTVKAITNPKSRFYSDSVICADMKGTRWLPYAGFWVPSKGTVFFYPQIHDTVYVRMENDEPDGGNSSIVLNPEGATIDESIRINGALAGSVNLGDKYAYPFVRVGFLLGKFGNPYDISDWNGVCIVYSSTVGFAIELRPADEATLTEYNNYKATVPKASSITVVNIPWEKFKQESGWGITIDRETALSHVYAVDLKFSGSAGTSGDFIINAVGALGTCGQ